MTIVKKDRNILGFPFLLNSMFENECECEYSPSLPPVNIRETENAYFIDLAVSGKEKKDINISLEDNQLTISSEREEEKEKEQGKYYRKEFNYNAFKRTFNLPENQIDEDKILASFKDGILNIHLPKKEEVKPSPPKTVKIV